MLRRRTSVLTRSDPLMSIRRLLSSSTGTGFGQLNPIQFKYHPRQPDATPFLFSYGNYGHLARSSILCRYGEKPAVTPLLDLNPLYRRYSGTCYGLHLCSFREVSPVVSGLQVSSLCCRRHSSDFESSRSYDR